MRHRPLLTWTLAFAAGIGLGAAGVLTPLPALGSAFLGAALLLLARRPLFLTLSLLLLGLGAGMLRLAAFQTVPASDLSRWNETPAAVTVWGTVGSDPEPRRGGRWTFFLRADRLKAGQQMFAVTGDTSVTVGADAARGQSFDYGDRVALRGTLETPTGATNPGAFSWREYLERRAIYSTLRVKRPGGVQPQGVSLSSPLLRLAVAVRRRTLAALHSSLPPLQAAVLGGILIGHRTELPPDLMADFVRTGTVHILASAGLHVGILALWLERLLRKLTLPRRGQAVLLIVVLGLYALVCGGRPAVMRAVLMAALYFGAILLRREPDLPTALGAAALVILLIQPTALLEPGFQLSFLTVGTLSLTMPLWSGFFHLRISRWAAPPQTRRAACWAADMTGLAFLAQLGSLPIIAAAYNEVSLSGVLANLVVVPALFVLIPLGFASIVLACLWPAGGVGGLTGAGWGAAQIIAVVRGFGAMSWGSFALPSPPPSVLACGYASLWAFAAGMTSRPDHTSLSEAPE